MSDQFDQMSNFTTLVADTGDVDAIKKYSPTDATTNPSLIFKAAQMPQYESLVKAAIEFGKAQAGTEEEKLAIILDRLCVEFGKHIVAIVPGCETTHTETL